MLSVKHHLPLSQARQTRSPIRPVEQRNAEAQGVTVEVYRLQERLRKLPLIPREEWLRKKRAELVTTLFVTARRDRCLSHVNPWAARDSNIPPIPH
jgi:hypothetical protein